MAPVRERNRRVWRAWAQAGYQVFGQACGQAFGQASGQAGGGWRGIGISPASAAAATALAVLVYSAAPVAAQSGRGAFDPYWEDFAPIADSAPIQPSKWNFGIKLGPYLPDVDSEFAGADMGPYAQTFGGGTLMTQFQFGDMPHDKVMRSMELFANEVLPHLDRD